ncbi:hypothetical protein C8R45DRAFT_1166412 [Mycena sanguinolenta]|nr:hypothetical protein C8R45DRAFT_1166412 [Mycena sanguinolenta]
MTPLTLFFHSSALPLATPQPPHVVSAQMPVVPRCANEAAIQFGFTRVPVQDVLQVQRDSVFECQMTALSAPSFTPPASSTFAPLSTSGVTVVPPLSPPSSTSGSVSFGYASVPASRCFGSRERKGCGGRDISWSVGLVVTPVEVENLSDRYASPTAPLYVRTGDFPIRLIILRFRYHVDSSSSVLKRQTSSLRPEATHSSVKCVSSVSPLAVLDLNPAVLLRPSAVLF